MLKFPSQEFKQLKDILEALELKEAFPKISNTGKKTIQ